jgi:multicomponent Na+:H+ antiporter subunit E
LFCFWLVIAGANPADLPTGIASAVVATWASLVLLPPGKQWVRLVPLTWFALRMMYQAVVAGFDVARRALDPRLPLRPGVISYRPDLSGEIARSAFASLMSLVPGTLPLGSTEDGALLVHCLDVSRSVSAGLRRDETLFSRALGQRRADA